MGKRLPEIINEEEFFKIMKIDKKKEHQIAFSLGFFCGLRISEVEKLTQKDIDYDRKMLFIREAKGGKDRYVPFPSTITKGLKHIPIKIKRRALQHSITKYGKKVLNKNIHFHTLRHGAATLYLSKGMNIRQVQQLLGHSRLDTTMIYTHVSPDEIKNKMDEIWGK